MALSNYFRTSILLVLCTMSKAFNVSLKGAKSALLRDLSRECQARGSAKVDVAERGKRFQQHRHPTLSPHHHPTPSRSAPTLQPEHHRGAQAMFSAKLTRAAHRATCNTTPHSTCAAAVVSTSSTASHTARPTSHARRHSSSKASSWPPDNSAGKPAPAAKSGVERDQPVSPPRAAPRQGKGRGRGYKRIAEVKKSAEPVDQFAGLPSVPVISGMRVEG